MDAIKGYLSSRAADQPTEAQCVTDARGALTALQRLGRYADDLLTRLETAQAFETIDRNQAEEARSTLGAISRETWNAHEALRMAIFGVSQLAEVEARLGAGIAMIDTLANPVVQLQAALVQINDLKAQLATAQPAAPDAMVVQPAAG